MRKLYASALAFALLAFAANAQPALAAHQTSAAKSHPGVWQDVMKPPLPEGSYGMGFTSTERVVARCTALAWSVRAGKNGTIRKYKRNYQTGYCLGWINSAMAFLNFHNEAGNHTLGVCMPENIQSMEVVKAFLDYVDKNKEETKYNPSLLIYWALLDKYPCK